MYCQLEIKAQKTPQCIVYQINFQNDLRKCKIEMLVIFPIFQFQIGIWKIEILFILSIFQFSKRILKIEKLKRMFNFQFFNFQNRNWKLKPCSIFNFSIFKTQNENWNDKRNQRWVPYISMSVWKHIPWLHAIYFDSDI